MVRIEPANNHRAVTELNYLELFTRVFKEPPKSDESGLVTAALNCLEPFENPDSGIVDRFLTTNIRHPRDPAEGNNGAYFLIRRSSARYDWGEIKPAPDLAAGSTLRGVRTIEKSPFPDEPDVYYFGGYTAGIVEPMQSNTAWIYKATLPNPSSAGSSPAVAAVLDGAGYTPDIAQGAIFVVKGSNLSPPGFTQASPPLYPNALNNVRIRLSAVANGAVVDALLVYIYNLEGLNQLAALLPSTAATGAYELRVRNGSELSPPFRVSAVARKPGIITADGSGSGEAQATLGGGLTLARKTNQGKIGVFDTRPARPGERVDLWGTGLGADAASDQGGTSGDQTVVAAVRILVNGAELAPLYAGRSQGSPGLDQIAFMLPTTVTLGCDVPVQIRAGGVLSNRVTIPVSLTDTCSGGSSSMVPLGQKRQLDWFDFRKDYAPGTKDENGRFMGGTDTMFLTSHQGRLYAGISYWNDNPGSDPSPGPQILVKESSSAGWRVQHSFGTEYLRVDALASVTFTTDKDGRPLEPPVPMLLASVSDQVLPYAATVWSQNQDGSWSRMVVEDIGPRLVGYARVIFDYVDKVTRIHHVFAAVASSALYRGSYDPSVPGRIRWEKTPELTGPERMLSAAVANGDLFVAVASAGDPGNRNGGVFRRRDGVPPTWESVYEWPLTGTLALGRNLRGLTAVVDPQGSGKEVLIGAIENLKQIVRIEPENGNRVTVELDLEDFFDTLWGAGASFNYAAYNYMQPLANPTNGRLVHFIGVWAAYPKPYGTEERNASYFLIRHEDGSYDWGQVRDPTIPIPPVSGLQALRTIAPSPFEDEKDRVWYVGGMDAGGTRPLFHNTAWIYRGSLKVERTQP